ncbi:MAG TPA: DUF4157 domain-containing protein [Polyangia bacterium]|nr:DUF4157 domain-containing protein [Polyangia bacterium]
MQHVRLSKSGKTPQAQGGRRVEPAAGPAVQPVMALQRALGNRAASALLADAQPKLTVSSADDRYEREADRLAEEAVQREDEDEDAEPLATTPGAGGVQRKPLSASVTPLAARAPRTAAAGARGGEVPGSAETALAHARGLGTSLPAGVRTPMERAFGADFGSVRVHTDDAADGLNRALGAQALTLDRDVYFRHGAYDPASDEGRETIAHELAHVLQQRAGGGRLARVVQRAKVKKGRKRRRANPLAVLNPTVKPISTKQAVGGGDRGAFESRIQWKLDAPPTKSGYVIQHVSETVKITNRATTVDETAADMDTQFGGYPWRATWSSYYELWHVDAGKKIPSSYNGRDKFAFVGYQKGAAADYQGRLKKTGTAWFFPSDKSMAALGFTSQNSPAGVLYCSTAAAAPAAALANFGTAVDHHVDVKWNDGVTNDQTVIVSQTP